MPYTDKQRRYFGAVASDKVKDKNLSKQEARKLLHEGEGTGWVGKLKKKIKKHVSKRGD